MSKLTMQYLLKVIEEIDSPVGAVFLSQKLSCPPATIGRLLKSAEDQGYLKAVSNKGRILTKKGAHYLKDLDALVEKKRAAEELIDATVSANAEHLLEILLVRKRLEPYAASLACANITEADINEFDNILFERSFELRKGRLGDHQDLQFHLKIAQLSGNTIIYQILKLLLTEDNMYTQFASLSERTHILESTEHDDIFQALQKRDAAAAELAAENHIDHLIDSLNRYASV